MALRGVDPRVGLFVATIASHFRAAFDKNDTKGWNCIVGRSFGAFVTHKIKTYIYFQVREWFCLLGDLTSSESSLTDSLRHRQGLTHPNRR